MDAKQLSQLPDDLQTLKALLVQRETALAQREAQLDLHKARLAEQQKSIEQLQRVNEGLSHRLDLALRRLYGRSSEKIDTHQLLLFGRSMQKEADSLEARLEAKAVGDEHSHQKKRGHGRKPLPPDLPRHRIEHPIDAAERTCPCCNQPRVRIGEEVSEQLDYTPASLFVLEHVRGKYACKRCEEGGVATAAKPAQGCVIEKGLPGPGLVAHVITSKYCDHLPLYRQESILARHGVDLARSTMCGWMKAAGDLLTPLAKRMAERIRGSKVIHTDDTPIDVQQKGKGKTKTGRMWVYIGDESNPYTAWDYTPNRKRDGPAKWLEGFEGYLQADAFAGYDGVYAGEKVKEVACWAHARRKFYDARTSDVTRAHHALGVIRRLYDVEADAKALSRAERAAMRQAKSKPLLDDLHKWLLEHQQLTLPKSPMGQAITYARNQWQALERYVGDGDLSIDNNAAERAIRPLTIGRKNYLFFGSDGGGRTAAVLYTMVASAKRHGLDPFVYLRDVLAVIGSTPISQLDQFLPDRWRTQQLNAIAEAEG